MLIKDEQLTSSEEPRSSKSNDSECPPVPLTSLDDIFSTCAPVLDPMNNKLSPPYFNKLSSVSADDKNNQNYPINLTTETLDISIVMAEKEKVESLQNLNAVLFEIDEELSQSLNEYTKNKKINNAYISNELCATKKKLENLRETEEMALNLGEIKSQLSPEMTRENCINMTWRLKKFVEILKLHIKKITPDERNIMSSKLLDVELTCAEVLGKKEETNSPNSSNKKHLKNIQNMTKIAMPRNDNTIVNLQDNKLTSKNIIMIKILEMIFSAMYILILEIRPNRMSYVFDIFSRIVCMFGFCGTLILIGNYVKNTNSTSNKKLLKWDLAFCTFMCLSYIWITFTIILTYHFYIVHPLSTLVIFSFLMQLIYFLEIRNILICKRD